MKTHINKQAAGSETVDIFRSEDSSPESPHLSATSTALVIGVVLLVILEVIGLLMDWLV